ncbi:MAG: MBL fold metallo-hydrolase [Woeseiaceae bacterium]
MKKAMAKNVVALVVLTAAAFCPALAQPPPAELELIQVRDNVYVIYNDFVPGNVTALVTNEGVVLIDDKFARDYENIVSLITSVTDQPVTLVVNTHYHADHSGSNVRFQEAGADVVATEMARAKMVETNQPGLPKITFEESARIHLDGVVIYLIHLGRGHTGGDLVAYFPEYQILVTGDLFVSQAGMAQLIDYAAGGSAREWPRTLEKIMQLGFETVIPGHGPVADRAALQSFRDRTLMLRNRVQEMLREQRSRDEIEAMLREDFGWSDLHVNLGLNGILGELR